MRGLSRDLVIATRIRAQQLDRPEVRTRPITDASIFDIGVQDTGRDGASWALANRGVPIGSPAELNQNADVALAWTLRSAPHFYRRAELVDVMTATSPFSEADAAKRVVGAGKPLRAADIGVREALAVVAAEMRRVVDKPRGKGEVSTLLTRQLAPPYLRWCGSCKTTHSWEVPFRVGALYGGLELEPGTSPPVLRRIPGWPRRRPGPAADPTDVPAHLQPIMAHLRLLGPSTPKDVAGFLDSTVADVKAHWPKDAVRVDVEGSAAWALDLEEAETPDQTFVRLLGPFDLLLQGKDRELLVPDRSRHKALWPVLGRPGAVLVGTDLVGTWRPTAAGSKFTLRMTLWQSVTKATRQRIDEQAERLADHRGLALAGVETESS
jgi:Winged helix DNA-binding domain